MTHLYRDPQLLQTWGPEDAPEGFIWRNTPHHILKIANRWTLHTRWWEPRHAIWRDYLKVVTDSGILCQIYRDRLGGGWYLARIYD